MNSNIFNQELFVFVDLETTGLGNVKFIKFWLILFIIANTFNHIMPLIETIIQYVPCIYVLSRLWNTLPTSRY